AQHHSGWQGWKYRAWLNSADNFQRLQPARPQVLPAGSGRDGVHVQEIKMSVPPDAESAQAPSENPPAASAPESRPDHSGSGSFQQFAQKMLPLKTRAHVAKNCQPAKALIPQDRASKRVPGAGRPGPPAEHGFFASAAENGLCPFPAWLPPFAQLLAGHLLNQSVPADSTNCQSADSCSLPGLLQVNGVFHKRCQ